MLSLRLEAVSRRYPMPAGPVVALDNLSLEVPAGQFVVVVGPNGSGKSTLLNLIAGDDVPDEGQVSATEDGRDLDWQALSPARRARHLARLRQDPSDGSADDLTVAEHLRLAELDRAPWPLWPALGGRGAQVMDRLRGTSLEARANQQVTTLSGGQRQLLALEMAAIRRAGLLLLDEPTAALDRRNAANCWQRLGALHTELPATIIVVTHDLSAAAAWGDRLLLLRTGVIAGDYTGAAKSAMAPQDVFELCEL